MRSSVPGDPASLAAAGGTVRRVSRELAALRHEESPDGRIQSPQKSVFGRLRDAFNPR